MTLASWRRPRLRRPTRQRLFGEPDREVSAIAKRRIIIPPARHPMPLTRNVLTALGVKLERHDSPP